MVDLEERYKQQLHRYTNMRNAAVTEAAASAESAFNETLADAAFKASTDGSERVVTELLIARVAALLADQQRGLSFIDALRLLQPVVTKNSDMLTRSAKSILSQR
jgi:hypothetical protein